MEIHSPMDAVELSRIRAIGEKVQQLQKEGRDIVRLQKPPLFRGRKYRAELAPLIYAR